ncbi:MAG TPA: hypothetical protein VFE89_02125, partial [Beijerinckiaceae bacterium]|nr:hypothetical protein [Beijerinckiaceae bacterium]
IQPALDAAVGDRCRMMKWQSQKVDIDAVAGWANDHVSEEWGKKAAARVFHICDSGKDIEIDCPFAPGAATEKADPISGSGTRCAGARLDQIRCRPGNVVRGDPKEERRGTRRVAECNSAFVGTAFCVF